VCVLAESWYARKGGLSDTGPMASDARWRTPGNRTLQLLAAIVCIGGSLAWALLAHEIAPLVAGTAGVITQPLFKRNIRPNRWFYAVALVIFAAGVVVRGSDGIAQVSGDVLLAVGSAALVGIFGLRLSYNPEACSD
jgi:hypothetical protein